MAKLKHRGWVPADCEALVQKYAAAAADEDSADLAARIDGLIARNLDIHDRDCFNLNPATNVMNPKAEAALAAGLGSRPSLGYPGDKYEMGLEAIEEIEVIAAELAAETFRADFAEIRVPSGAIANLYAFMATCVPGDRIVVPSPEIGGHVTHHAAGCAGLFELQSHAAPVDPSGYTVDLDAMESQPVSPSGPRNPDHRRYGRRQGAVRRRTSLRYRGGRSLARSAGPGSASDDDEHL